MYSNDLNRSQHYHTSSHLRKSRRQDKHDWNSTSWLLGEREKRDEGMLVLKADLLTKKLKHKHLSQDSLDYSRYSNLKSTKCPEFRRSEYPFEDKV